MPQAANTSAHNIVMTDPNRFFRDIDNCDMRPKQGSPTIDAGSASLAPKIDINSVPRPQGAGIDTGPYDFEDTSSAVSRQNSVFQIRTVPGSLI
jgi:hypothetical protein